MNSLSYDTLAYIFSFLSYNSALFLVSKQFNKSYHMSIERYGAQIQGVSCEFLVETSDHNDCCDCFDSGNYGCHLNECEYTSKTYTIDERIERIYSSKSLIDRLHYIFKSMKFYFIGINRHDIGLTHSCNKYLTNLIPKILFYNCCNSCTNSYECRIHNLDKHSYRITLISISPLL